MTGAGAGIGRAAALALAEAGAEVLATDRDPAALEGLAGMARLRTATLDVLDDAAIEALLAPLERVDILFNCAGVVHDNDLTDARDDEWDLAFALNARAQWKTARAVLPAMRAAGAGSIINVASVCGAARGLRRRFVYGASKAAVVGLTKSIAADLVLEGIRCNAISPGTVDSPSLHARIAAQPDPTAALAAFKARQPTGRFATPEEIAPLVVFLASDEAAMVTGQNYVIDGGMTI